MAIFKGTGVVWDNEKNKALCEFEGGHYDAKGIYTPGEFKTDDPAIIKKLESAGYKPVVAEPEPTDEPISEPAKEEPKQEKKAKKAKAE